MIFLIRIVIGWLIIVSGQTADFYDRHAEGWFWYQDPKFLEDSEETPLELNSKKERLKSPGEQASETLAAYKQKLEQTLHLALVNPTPQNVQQYMRLQKEMMERSERFAKSWQQVVLKHPELNHDLKFPTAHYARHVYDDQLQQKKKQVIHQLSKTFGLFYFFSGNCPYCVEFAPIVKMFADKYQWEVMAISLDGSRLDLFQNSQSDNGMAAALGVQSVPTLMAYNAMTQEIIPLSYSPVSLDQLEDNIMVLAGEEE